MRVTILYCFLASLLLRAGSVVASASDANAPRQYLDEETGASVFFVSRPLVFAHERPTFGSDVPRSSSAAPTMPIPARDYVTLAAAAVDRGGKYTYVLIAYFWAVGAAARQGENACFEDLVLQLGDRRLKLAPFHGSARDAGISQPIHRPSITDAKPAVYSSDLATLGLIAESAQPVLYCGTEAAPLTYELQEDRLPALRALVRHLSPDAAGQ